MKRTRPGRAIAPPDARVRRVAIAWVEGRMDTQAASILLHRSYAHAGLTLAHAVLLALRKNPKLAREISSLL